MYIKLNNSVIESYPYSFNQLKADNSQISFPANPTEELLAEYSVYPVKATLMPNYDYTQKLVEKTPELINGEWTQVWEVVNKDYDELLQTVLDLRANEYPPMSDYLDGIVKGDQAQVDKYIADCLAVKAKYPKP